jgi:hypothetical protein
MTENQRLANVVGLLANVSFGTMWWLRERKWKQIIPRELNYDLDSKKWGHPGVSILGGPAPLQSFIPMMHGRSKGNRNSVWIAGFDELKPNECSAFGHLIQAGKFPQLFLGHFQVEPSAFREEWARLFGNDCPLPTNIPQDVLQVKHKPKATPIECDRLREFLHRWKII